MMTPRWWAWCLAGSVAVCGAAPAAARQAWAGGWGYAAASAGPTDPQLPAGTFRYRIELTQAGDALAFTLSNPDVRAALTIGAVTVARATGRGTDFDPASVRRIAVSGKTAFVISPGRVVISDALPFAAKVGDALVVSVALTGGSHPRPTDLALPVSFVANRDATGDASPKNAATMRLRPFLSLVAVRNPAAACTIVALGDSITDGALSQSPTVRGWPGRLAARFAAAPTKRRCGVVNMGIGGNGVLRTIVGAPVLDRFWQDVASVPGVTHIIFLEGINDIGTSGLDGVPPLDADALIAGHRQLIARAHALGIKVIGGTLTPALHAGYMSADKDKLRRAVNAFVRTSGAYDGIVDFDAAVRDPASQSDLRADFDPGDHLHPNDKGYAAMGDAIELRLFDN